MNVFFSSHTDRSFLDWLDATSVDSMEEADLVIFTGGEDVSPELYGQATHPTTHANPNRDNAELDVWENAQELGKPVIGVCRGNQMTTVLNGGELFQNVSNHASFGTHQIITDDGEFQITSTHHQMSDLRNLEEGIDYNMIAYAPSISGFYANDTETLPQQNNFREPEIVFFPKTKSMGIQGHPEFGSCPQETRDLCKTLVNRLIDGSLAEDYGRKQEVS